MRFFLIDDVGLGKIFITYAQRCDNIVVSNWSSTAYLNNIWIFRPVEGIYWLLERIGTAQGEPLYSLSENEILSLGVVPPEALIEYINHIGTLNTWYKENT